MRQMKAATWFQWSCCPWKHIIAMTVNTLMEMTSWMTFSCMRLKGPPAMSDPMVLAGMRKQYSTPATSHDRRITLGIDHPSDMWRCLSKRFPYQAKVMNVFEQINSSIVYNPFMFTIILFSACKGRKNLKIKEFKN